MSPNIDFSKEKRFPNQDMNQELSKTQKSTTIYYADAFFGIGGLHPQSLFHFA
jgi:hypothetical protein